MRKPQLTELAALGHRLLDEEAAARLDQAIASDSLAAATEFDVLHDPSQVRAERNILRYVPLPVTIRAGATAKLEDILRVLSAGLALGQIRAKDPLGFERLFSGGGHMPMSLHLSTARPIPSELDSFLDRYGVEHSIEDSASFASNLQREGLGLDERIRLIAEDGDALRTALKGSIDIAIWDGPITGAGRIEILPFVHEQAISITNHRFGNRTPLSAQVLVD